MLQTLPVDIKEAATAALWHFVAPVHCLSNQIVFGLDAHQATTLFISVMLMRRSPLYSSAAARQTPESSPRFLKMCPADSTGDLSKQPQLGGTELPRTRAEMLIITAFPPYTTRYTFISASSFCSPPVRNDPCLLGVSTGAAARALPRTLLPPRHPITTSLRPPFPVKEKNPRKHKHPLSV